MEILNFSKYHPTTATAHTVRAVACQSGETDRSVSITYPASSTVVTSATRRPMCDAFPVTIWAQRPQRPPISMPPVVSPQRPQGWLEPPDHGAGELGGRSTDRKSVV